MGVHTYRTPRVFTENKSCKRWRLSGANGDLTNGLLMQGVPTHKMKSWRAHAMHTQLATLQRLVYLAIRVVGGP